MKLYITTEPQQAFNALKDFKGQKVSYILSSGTFKGTLRLDKKQDFFYIKTYAGRVANIMTPNVIMIVNDTNEVRILSNL